MSDVMTGNAANVTTPLTATVTALSSGPGGVVQVTTSAPHLFGPADRVELVTGVLSGIYDGITVVDAQNFTLPGTTFSSTSTGTVYDLSLTPQIQEPTDGDQASMQLGLLSGQQAILDRLQFLGRRAWQRSVTFTANGTWTCPPDVHFALVAGWGGGGGGECAGNLVQANPGNLVACGVGGAGAPLTLQMVPVTPGTAYAVTIGGGGAGGLTAFAFGSDGSGSIFGGTYVFPGGAGGGSGVGGGSSITNDGATPAGLCAPGGKSTPATVGAWPREWPTKAVYTSPFAGSSARSAIARQTGAGGSVLLEVNTGYASQIYNGLPGFNGVFGATGSAGGAAGTAGGASTGGGFTAYGGTGGAGGGGGPGGAGGAGGNGGSGVAGGTGGAGAVGSSAAANSGAGGGGSGQPGQGTTVGAAAAAGSGGSGQLTIYWTTGGLVP